MTKSGRHKVKEIAFIRLNGTTLIKLRVRRSEKVIPDKRRKVPKHKPNWREE
jgi:hypothetical protein